MPSERKIYSWDEIESIPCEGGVYAWYCDFKLCDHDIIQAITDLRKLGSTETEKAKSRITNFLQKFLFQPFLKKPYKALIKGRLNPTYKGSLLNMPKISEEMVKRIVADPERLWKLKEILEDSVPEFACPIYIGMSKNLKKRIGNHKNLIKKLRPPHNEPFIAYTGISQEEKKDHSFARDVVRRGFSDNNLYVALRLNNNTDKESIADIENILNRINHPICGRN